MFGAWTTVEHTQSAPASSAADSCTPASIPAEAASELQPAPVLGTPVPAPAPEPRLGKHTEDDACTMLIDEPNGGANAMLVEPPTGGANTMSVEPPNASENSSAVPNEASAATTHSASDAIAGGKASATGADDMVVESNGSNAAPVVFDFG